MIYCVATWKHFETGKVIQSHGVSASSSYTTKVGDWSQGYRCTHVETGDHLKEKVNAVFAADMPVKNAYEDEFEEDPDAYHDAMMHPERTRIR